jgi:phosphoglycolate phosphatase-like HAD superfamily hydrolase
MTGIPAGGSLQFGAGTVIPPDLDLLILDCFETLVELHGRSYRPRLGMVAFLDHVSTGRKLPVVVLSDGEQTAVEVALAQAGLSGRFAAIVGAPESLGQLPDGRVLKRLDLLIKRFAVTAARTVFIGDSPLDAQAAQHHGVPFIRVPRSEDELFTFTRLITGPSRYQSSEFSSVFLERYLRKP